MKRSKYKNNMLSELETVISELNKEKKEKELIRMINKKKMAYEKKKEE
jgi:hypothetical protein